MSFHLQRSRTSVGHRPSRKRTTQIAFMLGEEDFDWLVRRSVSLDLPLAAILRQAVKLLRRRLPDD